MASQLSEIAQRAGVSIATVTRVLNAPTSYRRGFYARRAEVIRAIAAEMGYRPSVAAQAMGSGRFNTICLLSGADRGVGHLPPQLVDGVCEAASRLGYMVHVARLGSDALSDPRRLPPVLARRALDGLVVNWTHALPPAVEATLAALEIPAVWLNTDRAVDCVRYADREATVSAVRRLAAMGHRRILWYAPGYDPADYNMHYSSQVRAEGFRAACAELGLEGEMHTQVGTAEEVVAHVVARMRREPRPTAVIATSRSDLLVQGCERAGVQVPRDLTVLVFSRSRDRINNLPIAHLRLPDALLGGRGVELLVARIAGGAATPAEELPIGWADEQFLRPPG